MHDLRWIREHPEEFDRSLVRRRLPPRADEILALDRSWRGADFFGESVPLRLHPLGLGLRFAPLPVEIKQRPRGRRQPPARQAAVISVGIFANPPQIEHARRL